MDILGQPGVDINTMTASPKSLSTSVSRMIFPVAVGVPPAERSAVFRCACLLGE